MAVSPTLHSGSVMQRRRIPRALLAILAGSALALGSAGCSKKNEKDEQAAKQAPAPKTVAPKTVASRAEPGITSRLPQPAKDLTVTPGQPHEAVFAGGCYWCVEAVYEMFDGISDVVSGYAGGSAEDAVYPKVATGKTGHAEVVKVTYDANKISYATLLRIFMATHDPTSLNKQGADEGPHYRSAVFYQSEEEKAVAQAYIDQLTEAKVYDKPIVTTLEPLDKFYEAEADQQNYARLHPDDEYIKKNSDPLVQQAKSEFSGLLKTP